MENVSIIIKIKLTSNGKLVNYLFMDLFTYLQNESQLFEPQRVVNRVHEYVAQPYDTLS